MFNWLCVLEASDSFLSEYRIQQGNICRWCLDKFVMQSWARQHLVESRCNNCCVQVALPSQPPWWELFDVRFEDICEVACEMQALYARPKAQYISVREELQVGYPLVCEL